MKKNQGEKIEKKIKEKKEKIEKVQVIPEQVLTEPKNIEPTVKPKKIAINIHKNTIIAIIIIIVIALIGGLFFYFKSLFIAATVNGSPISRLAVVSELETTYGKKTLESLVTKKLIDDEAVAKGVIISSADIDAEVKTVEDQLKAQGMTLENALIEQGVTLEYLKKQILVQKELEGLLADQLQVSEEEINKFIEDNKITIPEGEEANYKEQITEQLKQEKLSTAASALLESLKEKSKINYFISY